MHPANMPDKDEVPGLSLAALPAVTTAHSVAVEPVQLLGWLLDCWSPSRSAGSRVLLTSSGRHVLEAAAAVQPPCGSVPTRPGSVGVTVVEGARRCSRSASGPRPNRCTRSAP